MQTQNEGMKDEENQEWFSEAKGEKNEKSFSKKQEEPGAISGETKTRFSSIDADKDKSGAVR